MKNIISHFSIVGGKYITESIPKCICIPNNRDLETMFLIRHSLRLIF